MSSRIVSSSVLSLGVILAFSCQFSIAVGEEPIHSVSRASCGAGERAESVQGETTLAERFAPGPSKAYNCNLELVGQFDGEGTSADMRVFEPCVYYPIAPYPQVQKRGVAVLDISESGNPKGTAYLQSPAMLNALESLEIDRSRKLLLASNSPTLFDVYDLTSNCRHPVLISSVSLPGTYYHSGKFASDGRTFYGASCCLEEDAFQLGSTVPHSAVFALDVSDPSNLRSIAKWIPPQSDWGTHSVSVNEEGTRAYVVLSRMADDSAKLSNPNGLVVLDISDIQARRQHAQFRVVSTLFWDDSHFGEYALPVKIKGWPYLIWTDVAGALGLGSPPPANACQSGRPGHGFARIIDLGDERHPKTVSRLMLEVSDPTYCAQVMHDPTIGIGYGSWGCSTDNDQDATLLACGYFEAGLRVFDIRNPSHPSELAYYKPPGRRTQSRPGSLISGAPPKDHTTDPVVYARFLNHAQDIGFNSLDGGFEIVRFTDRFKASHADLFRK